MVQRLKREPKWEDEIEPIMIVEFCSLSGWDWAGPFDTEAEARAFEGAFKFAHPRPGVTLRQKFSFEPDGWHFREYGLTQARVVYIHPFIDYHNELPWSSELMHEQMVVGCRKSVARRLVEGVCHAWYESFKSKVTDPTTLGGSGDDYRRMGFSGPDDYKRRGYIDTGFNGLVHVSDILAKRVAEYEEVVSDAEALGVNSRGLAEDYGDVLAAIAAKSHGTWDYVPRWLRDQPELVKLL